MLKDMPIHSVPGILQRTDLLKDCAKDHIISSAHI